MEKTTLKNKYVNNSALQIENVERFTAPVSCGLTAEQVNQRCSEGLVNFDNTKRGKSTAQIILSNLFTFFNIIYMIIAGIYIVTAVICKDVVLVNDDGSTQSALAYMLKQMSFLPVVIANTLIAIIQELKSKNTLKKLNLITEPQIEVMRDGVVNTVAVSELVLDDVMYLKSGEQISADAVILDGFVEVNESILTGESDAVTKRVGDTLFAGSYVVSGCCTARVDKVGRFNYISGLTSRARQYQKPRSQMLSALRTILIFVAVIIAPMAVGLSITNFRSYSLVYEGNELLIKVLVPTASSIVNMIPAGPFLLTSAALAVSVIRLSKSKTMVQELYCIEMLARVNCLCLDKTGTITDGTMKVVESIDLRPTQNGFTVREIVSSMNSALKADNMTAKALKKFFGAPQKTALEAQTVVPFSSERKFSAVSFKGEGTYFIGAPEFVLKTPNERVSDLVKKYAEEGLRVLLLAHSSTSMYDSSNLPTVRRPIAVIVIEDHIRSDAVDTIGWFKQNGVEIKVISGDNPVTVSNIAVRVGVENGANYISLEGMSEEEVIEASTKYTVFGRVSPEQKAILIRSLRQSGKTVAMTGDGVNDILAMKESDCSISLAGGSDAARKVSHLVLLDDNFSALPRVVAEGRRVVNNIQSATSMYFMKTIYMLVINITIIVMELIGKPLVVPFTTSRLLLLDAVIVGVPTTLLALQPNEKIIEGRFLTNVLKRCLPASLTFLVGSYAIYAIAKFCGGFEFVGDNDALGTVITVVYTMGGFFALYYACRPFNKWKVLMYVAIGVIVVGGILLFGSFFDYRLSNLPQLMLTLCAVLATPYVLFVNMRLFSGRTPKYTRRK